MAYKVKICTDFALQWSFLNTENNPWSRGHAGPSMFTIYGRKLHRIICRCKLSFSLKILFFYSVYQWILLCSWEAQKKKILSNWSFSLHLNLPLKNLQASLRISGLVYLWGIHKERKYWEFRIRNRRKNQRAAVDFCLSFQLSLSIVFLVIFPESQTFYIKQKTEKSKKS